MHTMCNVGSCSRTEQDRIEWNRIEYFHWRSIQMENNHLTQRSDQFRALHLGGCGPSLKEQSPEQWVPPDPCSSQAERQRRLTGTDLAAGSARCSEPGHPWQTGGTPPVTAAGEGLVPPKPCVVVEYNESGGCVCNSRYSLLFSSGIPLRIVPLKKRFVQTATMYINQKNTEYRCLWVVPSKDNSSKEKIFFRYLTFYLWSTPCPWSRQTLVNTVITARPLNQRCTPHPSKRTAWTPLASPPNCRRWRAPAFRNDSDHTHTFFEEILQNTAGFLAFHVVIFRTLLYISVRSQPFPCHVSYL